MSDFLNLILLFSTMYTVQHVGCVTSQHSTDSPVYQLDAELSVDVGDSAALQCCVSAERFGMMAWFKQTRKKFQPIVKFFKTFGNTFYNGFEKSRFQIGRYTNCFNLTILNIILSDEAMYFCALTEPKLVFADGTYLKIKETSRPALCDHSEACEQCRETTLTVYGNNTNSHTQEKIVKGFGTALGFCTLLIFCLTCFILRKRKYNKMNNSIENSAGLRQTDQSEANTLHYSAVQFAKKKAHAVNRKTDLQEDCVYSDVIFM